MQSCRRPHLAPFTNRPSLNMQTREGGSSRPTKGPSTSDMQKRGGGGEKTSRPETTPFSFSSFLSSYLLPPCVRSVPRFGFLGRGGREVWVHWLPLLFFSLLRKTGTLPKCPLLLPPSPHNHSNLNSPPRLLILAAGRDGGSGGSGGLL